MALKQNCPAGGSITLNATDTVNNYTLLLPATNDTLATLSTAGFPSGTRLVFPQAAAPTGWTKVTTYNDYALRIVSGAGGGTGGSVAFSTAFASQTPAGTVGDTTLAVSQMPSHNHVLTAGGVSGGGNYFTPYSGSMTVASTSNVAIYNTGGGGSHTHSFSGTAINLAVQYIDTILASKN